MTRAISIFIRKLIFISIFTQNIFADTAPVNNLQESQPNVYALINANIQINPDELLKDANLIIRGDRIENVGIDIPIPQDAFEIDLTGKIIYPGFIESWFEFATPDSIQHQASNWNKKVHPEFSAIESKQISKKQIDEFHKNGITAVHIIPNEGILEVRQMLDY